MDTKTATYDLMKKRDELIRQKEELVEQIKRKYPKAYQKLVEKNVDLSDLSKYSKSIAAALLVVASTVLYSPQNSGNGLNTDTHRVELITADELAGIDDEQKAKLVLDRYGRIIDDASDKYQIDPKLIFSTIMVESGGNTFATRGEPSIGDASYGLGQILYGTAVGIGYEGNTRDLYKPEVNVDLIAKYYRYNLNKYGSLTNEQLVTAYNSGNPYGYALPGHLNKFRKWYYGIADNLMSQEQTDDKIAGITTIR